MTFVCIVGCCTRRRSGSVPAFTRSFGVTDSTVGRSLGDPIDVADVALLSVRYDGRDRIVAYTTATGSTAVYVPE